MYPPWIAKTTTPTTTTNAAPSVTITAASTTVAPGGTVALTATAADSDGQIAGDPQFGRRRRTGTAQRREIERFTDVVGDLPETVNALRDRPVHHVAQSGEVAPQAAPDLILHLHAGYSSEVAS